jgi:hypothetical protein
VWVKLVFSPMPGIRRPMQLGVIPENSQLLILLLVWAIHLTLASLAMLVTQRIQKSYARKLCMT